MYLAEIRTQLSSDRGLRPVPFVQPNCIYVIEDGRAVESGSHAELIAFDGAYRAFFAAQFGLGALPQVA